MGKKVLVADDDALVARLLQQTLQKAGFTVETVADGKTARERLSKGGYNAVVTDWMMPELDGIELVRFTRTKPEPIYVALITELNIPAAQSHALQQGADDFFTKPLVPAQLVQSMSAWFDRLAKGLVKARSIAAAPGAGTSEAMTHPVARTEAWKDLPRTTRQVLSDTLQVPLAPAAAWERAPDDAVTCLLPTIDAEHLLELHVIIEAPMASAVEIARAMLGEADAEDVQTLRDIVSELGNITAGNVKASFAKEAFPFTLGLAKAAATSNEPYALVCAVGLRAQGVEVVARFGVRPRNSVKVLPADLREGWVLAENVYTSAGGLLLPAGTRLTSTAADRLRGALKGQAIKVCAPDAPARGG